jgi:hypothetical protein
LFKKQGAELERRREELKIINEKYENDQEVINNLKKVIDEKTKQVSNLDIDLKTEME